MCIMTLSKHTLGSSGKLKRNVKNVHTCPLCKERFEIGVEDSILTTLIERDHFPYPHIHIHGNPVHALLCYIDKNLTIRSTGVIQSIEISRDSDTFAQIMHKWSNPY